MSITDNYAQVNKVFTEYSDEVGTDIDEELDYLADLMQNGAEADAPRDTGYMASNIVITNTGTHSRTVTAIAEYSGYVDQGTWKMQANPFFTGNVEKIESTEMPNIEKRLGTKIDAKLSIMRS